MGLRVPTGTRPDDLSQPVPGVDQLQQTAQGAAEQTAALGRTPAAEPSGDTAGLMQEFDTFSPEAQALAAEFEGGAAPANTFQVPSPQIREVDNIVGWMNNLVRKPDGDLAVRNPDGTLRQLHETEKEFIAGQRRILSALPAAVAGGVGLAAGAMSAGAASLPVIAGVNAVAASAGELADIAALPGRQTAQEVGKLPVEPEPSGLQRLGHIAASTAIGTGIGAAIGSFASSGLQRAGAQVSPELEQALYSGATQASKEALEASQAIKATGIPALPEQVNITDPGIKELASKAASGELGDAVKVQRDLLLANQRAAIQKHVQDTIDRFPELSPEALAEFSPKKVLQDIVEGTPKVIAQGKREAQRIAGDRRFNVEGLDARFQQVRSELLRGNTIQGTPDELDRAWLNFQQDSSASGDIAGLMGGDTGRGMTLKQLDQYTTYLQKQGFEGADTPVSSAFRQLAFEARIARDMALEQAVAPANPALAQEIRAGRQLLSQNREVITTLERALKNDPENFTRVILPKDRPAFAQAVVKLFPEETLQLIRRQHVENVFGDAAEIAKGGKIAAAERAFLAPGESSLETLYGKDFLKDTKTLFKALRVTENAPASSIKAASETSAVKIVAKIMRGKWGQAIGDAKATVIDALTRNKKAQEYLSKELLEPSSPSRILKQAEIIPPSPEAQRSADARQVIGALLQSGKIRAGTAGAVTGGSQAVGTSLVDMLLNPPKGQPQEAR